MHEVRHSRRSSYGSDLDAPVISHEQTRPRAHSNDQMLRGEHSAIQHDELPAMFPWRNDVLPEQRPLPSKKESHGLEHLVDKHQPRPLSQIGFEKVIESARGHIGNHDQHRLSSHKGDSKHDQFASENDKLPYGNGSSTILNLPAHSPLQLSDSKYDFIGMPALPNRVADRSPSPTTSPTRTNFNRERPSDIAGKESASILTFVLPLSVLSLSLRTDNFSRLTIAESQHDSHSPKHSSEKIASVIASENPLVKHDHSSSSEHKSVTETWNTTNFDREAHHSCESSPSAVVHGNPISSPTSGYASSSAHSDGISRDSTSPPSAHVPQHDYLNVSIRVLLRSSPIGFFHLDANIEHIRYTYRTTPVVTAIQRTHAFGID